MHHFSTLKITLQKMLLVWFTPKNGSLRITSSRVRQVCPAEQTRIAWGDIMRHVWMSRKLLILHRFQSYCCWNPVWKPVEVGRLSHYLHGFMTIPGGFRHFSSKLSNLCQSYPNQKKGRILAIKEAVKAKLSEGWKELCRCFQKSPFENLPKKCVACFFFGFSDMFCGFPKWVWDINPIS